MLDDLKSQLGSTLRTLGHLLDKRPAGQESARRPSTRGAPGAEAQRQRARRMRRDLYDLMEQHGGSRQLMRHLDLVERTLREQGLAAVEALPTKVIAKALEQMEKLVWDWSPVGLAELRSRMALMVKERAREPGLDVRDIDALGLQLIATPASDLTEIERAAFAEMERSWAGRLPDGAQAAMAAAKASA